MFNYNERSTGTVRRYLRHMFPNEVVLIDNYINEFEHQEGDNVWKNQFDRLSQVADDFVLFRDNQV